MSKEIKVTENLSDLHNYDHLDMGLWLTPGSGRPYWSNNASFMYDECVATPHDFLEAAGYDCFDDDPDYDEVDEAITLKVKLIPYVEHR